jgi:hypothetical protein
MIMKITPIANMIYPIMSGILSATAPSVHKANGIATIMIPITARIRPVTHRLCVDVMVDKFFFYSPPIFYLERL